ncbi:SPARC-related modular calcium-binding protein 1 [Aplysia californica]|uniref:SPARC-related modular calcium-binding protein 1 n=1 Tax=Aplysia californica TaxID=6500 RepID=A0ABM1ABV4_APLCA|nr:SPARC-related modular calcium-binding protein 1 [Aplysia californica]
MTSSQRPGMNHPMPHWKRKCLGADLIQLLVTTTSLFILMSLLLSRTEAVSLSQVDGKTLFQSLRASQCSVNCVTSKIRPVCGTDDVTYSSRCELKRAKKCDGKRIKVKHKGSCPSDCLTDRHVATENARTQNPEVLIPTCNSDGTYSEVQCHTSTGYCWCVTRDGRHIPGTSTAGRRPRCKGKRKRKKGRGGKTRKRKACNSKDRQTFNAALIKVFKEEYDRVNPTPPPDSDGHGDEFGTEKAIVVWKFNELDTNKDSKLKFKEIRNFGRMVRKLIKPRPCAKRFLKFCDKNRDRIIEKAEWTLCLGVDIKLSFRIFISLNSASSGSSAAGDREADGEDHPQRPAATFFPPAKLPVLSSGPSSSTAPFDPQDRKDTAQSCPEERESAMAFNSQEPNAKPFIPVCTAKGDWEKAQCHSTGHCWCVQEKTGIPIPGTATYRVKPNCTFENEREMKGCPFEQKRRFLVDLIGDLTRERKKALQDADNQADIGSEDNLSLRETVARWKLKTLDKNNNGVLERKEWRPLRRSTLKNKAYPRRCRRSFLRYCDVDKNKKITYDEWKDCLGLNHNYFNSLPLNPNRHGEKNPFMDQLT